MARIDLVVLDVSRLTSRRIRRGVSRTGLAKAAGLHAATVRTALAGRPVSLRAGLAIARALDLNFGSLVRTDVSRSAATATTAAANSPAGVGGGR